MRAVNWRLGKSDVVDRARHAEVSAARSTADKCAQEDGPM